jgi:CheY-like chemotaxis protein
VIETLSAKKILVVEDDQGIRETLIELLGAEGYLVLSASDGLEALQVLRQANPKPDLILLDIMMPVMDGLNFRVEQLKDSSISGVPVVVMSADQKIIEKKEKIGAIGHIKKPLDLDVFLGALKKYC